MAEARAVWGAILGLFICTIFTVGLYLAGASTAASPTPTPTVLPERDTPVAAVTVTPTELPLATSTPRVVVVSEDPLQRIQIPSIKLDSAVKVITVERDSKGQLQWGDPFHDTGRLATSAQPGQVGNMVITGHVEFGPWDGVFRHLNDLHSGDTINFLTARRIYHYRVRDEHLVLPTDLSPIADSTSPIATLITCWPPKDYSKRLVVVADLVGVDNR